MRSPAREVKEKFSTCSMMEDAGILWRGHPRWGISIRVEVIYRGSNHDVCGV